jgi:S-phase kinase-associated protein 1
MATATADPKLISITTSDGVVMKPERAVAERSILIKNLLEDLGGDTTDDMESIPIPNVCARRSPRTFLKQLLTSCRSTRLS